jgi:hypothetical protein
MDDEDDDDPSIDVCDDGNGTTEAISIVADDDDRQVGDGDGTTVAVSFIAEDTWTTLEGHGGGDGATTMFSGGVVAWTPSMNSSRSAVDVPPVINEGRTLDDGAMSIST